MAFETLMIITLPGLEGVAKLLAILVALYFPLVMFVWFAVDKLQRAGDDRPEVARQRRSPGLANLGVIRDPRRSTDTA